MTAARGWAIAAARRGAVLATLGALLALALGPNPGRAGDEVRFLTWEDYIAPEVIARFEARTGNRIVVVPVVSGTQLLAELRSGQGDYDLANPLDHQIALLIAEGRLERIDSESLAHYANIEEPWRQPPYDRNNRYTVPFHWGTTAFAVDTAVYDGDIDSYGVLFNPPAALKGRISHLIGAGEVIQMGLTYLGLPPCSTRDADIERVLELIRPGLDKDHVTTIATVIDTLSGAGVAAGVAWNGDALRARQKKPSLRYAYPREGALVWADALVVPKGARHHAAAVAFMDFMLLPENAAAQSNFTRYANSIRGSDAFLAPENLEAPEIIVPSRVKISFMEFCGGDAVDLHENRYNQELLKHSH